MNKNYIILFLILCLGVCACTEDKSDLAYAEIVENEISINNILIESHVVNANYQKKTDSTIEAYLDTSIKFPQISQMQDSLMEKKINKTLKDIVSYSLYWQEFEEILTIFDNIVNDKIDIIFGGENEYTLLYVGDKCISLSYKGYSYSGGVSPYFFENHVTISLETGEMIAFTQYCSKQKVIDAIKAMEFEWIAGQYIGGYSGTEQEVLEEFAFAVTNLKEINDADNLYNYNSVYNFAIDEEFVFIGFPFYDSLDGYVILKFNKSALAI
ncbi:DUF4163 domain-containing protein [Lachnospiraceae bacterium OttesenSCG-928-D06]|nr:DUF4163 domain-containing protein [Lachnospiraceae bacterium OttesenSCG-928-D06]